LFYFDFDERGHLSDGISKIGITFTDFIQIAAGVVLLPELLSQVLTGGHERDEFVVEIARRCQQSIQVVCLYKLSTVGDQISLQISFSGFMKQFHPSP
jgi:hypothetical protein